MLFCRNLVLLENVQVIISKLFQVLVHEADTVTPATVLDVVPLEVAIVVNPGLGIRLTRAKAEAKASFPYLNFMTIPPR
jgi:hypothetical protein